MSGKKMTRARFKIICNAIKLEDIKVATKANKAVAFPNQGNLEIEQEINVLLIEHWTELMEPKSALLI